MANLLATCATNYGSSTQCWSSGDIKAANFWVCSGSDSYSLGQGTGILDIWISDSSISHQPRSIFRAYNQGNCIILGHGCSANTNATIPVYACNCLQSPKICATSCLQTNILRNHSGNPYVNVYSGCTGPGGIYLRACDGTSRGYVYFDGTSNFGLLNCSGQWAIRIVGNQSSNSCMYTCHPLEAAASFKSPILCATSCTNYGACATSKLTSDGDMMKHTTQYGFISLGPANSSWAHINTDRNCFYIHKPIAVDGGQICSYDENLILQCAGSTTARIVIGSGTTTSCQSMAICGNVGIGRTPSNYPLMLKGNTRYQLALCNSGSGDSDYPWFVHDNDNLVIHFNGIADRFCFHNSGAFCATSCVKTTRVCSFTAACVCACAYAQGSIVVGSGTAATCVGSFGGWYDIAELTEWNTPAHWSIKTCAHNTLTFTTTRGYHGSNTASINILSSTYTANNCYIHVNCLRIACQANNSYMLQAYLCRTSGTGCLGAIYVTVHNLNQAWIHGTSMNVSLCACLCPGVSCNTITSQLTCSNTHRMSCSLSVCGSVTTGTLCATSVVKSGDWVCGNRMCSAACILTPTCVHGDVLCATSTASISGDTDNEGLAIGQAYSNEGSWNTQLNMYGRYHDIIRIKKCAGSTADNAQCLSLWVHDNHPATIQSTGNLLLKADSCAVLCATGDTNTTIYYNGTAKAQTLCRGFRACGQTAGCGYLDLCPNGTWGHLITDRSKFYANKPWIVDTGCVGSYNEDLTLHRGHANSTAGERIVITSGTTHICQLAQFYGNICSCTGCIKYPFYAARYSDTNENYRGVFCWNRLQLGNNGPNQIIAGDEGGGGRLEFYVNNTADATSTTNGTLATVMCQGGGVYSCVCLQSPIVCGTSCIQSGVIKGCLASTSGDGQNNLPFRLATDYNSFMVATAGCTWGLFWAGNSGAKWGTNGVGGPGNIWSNSSNPNEFVFVGAGCTDWTVHGGYGRTWQRGEGCSAVCWKAPVVCATSVAELAKIRICCNHNCLHMASTCDAANYNFTICSMYNWACSLTISNRNVPILKACSGNCITSLWGNNTERICLHPTGTKIVGNLCVTGTITADGMEGDTLVCAGCCTGTICFNTSCVTGLDAVYDIYVSANPNCGGSTQYRDIVHLTSYVTTGYSGSAVTKYINTINRFSRNDLHGSGAGEVTATAKLLVGTTGADSYAVACATCLQVQVSGGAHKNNTCVIIKKVL